MDVGGAGLIEDGWKNRRTHHEENADKSLTTRKFLVSTVSLNVGYRKNSAYVQPVSCPSVIISCMVIILGLKYTATQRRPAGRRARPGACGAVDLVRAVLKLGVGRFSRGGAGGSRRVYYCTAGSSILVRWQENTATGTSRLPPVSFYRYRT